MSDSYKVITQDELKNVLRARVTESTSMRECARELGVTAAHVSSVLLGDGRLGPKLLRALGYRSVPMYQKVVKS